MRVVVFLFFIAGIYPAMAQSSVDKLKATEIQADTLLNRQDFKGALKLYNKILASKKRDTETGFVFYKRAICFYSLDNFELALQDLNIFIPAYPSFPQGRLLRAFVNRELGNLQAQLVDISELSSLDPLNVDILKWKASVLLELGDYDQAKPDLLHLSNLQEDEEIEMYLGLTYFYTSNPDSALLHFDKSIAINGGYVQAYLYAALLCVEQAAYDLALTYINLGLRLEPSNVGLILYKGIALVEKDDLDAGCSCLAKAFYAGADDAEGYLKEYCYQAND